jgi:hypothetical protein
VTTSVPPAPLVLELLELELLTLELLVLELLELLLVLEPLVREPSALELIELESHPLSPATHPAHGSEQARIAARVLALETRPRCI